MTVVDAVAVLLDELGSEVEELTEAALVMVLPSLGAVTRIVVGGGAPGGRVLARVQATPVLVLDDPAAAMTVVAAVRLLLDELGSEVEELTEAVLVMVLPSLGAVTRIVMGGAAPGGRVLARVQATLVLVPLQVQPAPLAPWKVTPGGSESVTLIGAAAVLGPALLTVSV